MEHVAVVQALELNGKALIDAAAGSADVLVPTCPGWDVAHLLRHLRHIHGWAARNVAALPEERVRLGRPDTEASPEDCREMLDALVHLLRRTRPEVLCAGPLSPRTAAWWARRQLLETVVHRWDLANAVGVPTEIDPAVAAMGVAEFVEVFAAGTAMPVQVHATDAEVLLLLWGRLALDHLSVDGDPEAYWSWRSAIAT